MKLTSSATTRCLLSVSNRLFQSTLSNNCETNTVLYVLGLKQDKRKYGTSAAWTFNWLPHTKRSDSIPQVSDTHPAVHVIIRPEQLLTLLHGPVLMLACPLLPLSVVNRGQHGQPDHFGWYWPLQTENTAQDEMLWRSHLAITTQILALKPFSLLQTWAQNVHYLPHISRQLTGAMMTR